MCVEFRRWLPRYPMETRNWPNKSALTRVPWKVALLHLTKLIRRRCCRPALLFLCSFSILTSPFAFVHRREAFFHIFLFRWGGEFPLFSRSVFFFVLYLSCGCKSGVGFRELDPVRKSRRKESAAIGIRCRFMGATGMTTSRNYFVVPHFTSRANIMDRYLPALLKCVISGCFQCLFKALIVSFSIKR